MEKIYFGERYFFAKAYGKHEVNNEKNRTCRRDWTCINNRILSSVTVSK